jgi:hypothetical protein
MVCASATPVDTIWRASLNRREKIQQERRDPTPPFLASTLGASVWILGGQRPGAGPTAGRQRGLSLAGDSSLGSGSDPGQSPLGAGHRRVGRAKTRPHCWPWASRARVPPANRRCSACFASSIATRWRRRELIASTDLADYLDWPVVQQVFRLGRTWREQGKAKQARHYGITSLTPVQAGLQVHEPQSTTLPQLSTTSPHVPLQVWL